MINLKLIAFIFSPRTAPRISAISLTSFLPSTRANCISLWSSESHWLFPQRSSIVYMYLEIGPAPGRCGRLRGIMECFVSRRWVAFALGSGASITTTLRLSYSRVRPVNSIGNELLTSDPGIIIKPTDELMAAMKAASAMAVTTGVNRAELEYFRSSTSRVRGEAETCAYSVQCACSVPTAAILQKLLSGTSSSPASPTLVLAVKSSGQVKYTSAL